MDGFAEDVRKCREGSWDGRFALEVRPDTPRALVRAGLPDLPMDMTARHVADAMRAGLASNGAHSLPEGLVASLPSLLSQPVAAWESGRGDGRLSVLLDASDGARRPVVCVVQPGGRALCRAGERESNFVVSAYGARRASVERSLSSAERDGRLLMVDRAKLRRLETRCGIEPARGTQGAHVRPPSASEIVAAAAACPGTGTRAEVGRKGWSR